MPTPTTQDMNPIPQSDEDLNDPDIAALYRLVFEYSPDEVIPRLRLVVASIRSGEYRPKHVYTELIEKIYEPIIHRHNLASKLHDAEMAKLQEAKDNAYYERDQLVAALSKIYPAWMGYHQGEWEDDWRYIVYVKLPTGQISWHIHDSELPNFKHLENATKLSEWDGHTTEEKYKRLAALQTAKENKS